MGMWPGDPHGVCRNDLTPEGGVPVELLGSSKQGSQAPRFTLLLSNCFFSEVSLGHCKATKMSSGWRGRPTRLSNSWFWCLKQLTFMEMYLIYLKK